MKNKIPCGGFYLDDTLNVNDSGELSIKGGIPYQQLVTDGDGNARWEDKMIVDSELSDTSTNPVQNKVIKSALDAKLGVYEVTITMNGMTGETSVDKTFDEIKTAYSSGMLMFAKYVISYEDMNIIRGLSTTCNYRPSDNTIIFTFGFGEAVLEGGEQRSAKIGTIAIDSNNNIAIQDRDSVISSIVSNRIVLISQAPGSTKQFKITVDDTGTISATEVT